MAQKGKPYMKHRGLTYSSILYQKYKNDFYTLLAFTMHDEPYLLLSTPSVKLEMEEQGQS